jgi:hypothetical protein
MTMIKNQQILKSMFCWIGSLAFIFSSPLSYAQEPVTVTSLAVHSAGNVQYTYQVSNHTSARNIYTISIGNRGDKSDDPATQANEQPELSVYPSGSYWEKQPDEGDSHDVSLRMGGTFTSPQGWNVHILEYEQTSWPGIETKFSVNWSRENRLDPGMLPSQTLQYGVTVPQRDQPYVNGHFTVRFTHSILGLHRHHHTYRHYSAHALCYIDPGYALAAEQ